MKIYSRRYENKVQLEEITSDWTTNDSENKYWLVCTKDGGGSDQTIVLDSSSAPKNVYIIQNERPSSYYVSVEVASGEYLNGVEDGYNIIEAGETWMVSNDGNGKWWGFSMTNVSG